MGEGQLRAAGRWGPGTWDGTPRHKVWVPRKDLSSDASPTCGQPPLETAATVSSSGDGAPGSSVHVSAPQLVLSVGQSCSELSGPCSPPHRVRSPTPSADRTIAGPATVRWRPGPGAPLPPAPQTTSSWLQSKERTSRLVRAVAQGGALAGVPMGPGPPTGTGTGGLEASPLSGEGGLRPGPAPVSITIPLSQAPRTPRMTAWMPRSAGWQGSLDGWRTRWARRAPISIPPFPRSPSQPAREGGIRPEFTRGKSGNLNAPGWGWGVVWTKGRPWEHGLCTCMGPGEEEL